MYYTALFFHWQKLLVKKGWTFGDFWCDFIAHTRARARAGQQASQFIFKTMSCVCVCVFVCPPPSAPPMPTRESFRLQNLSRRRLSIGRVAARISPFTKPFLPSAADESNECRTTQTERRRAKFWHRTSNSERLARNGLGENREDVGSNHQRGSSPQT